MAYDHSIMDEAIDLANASVHAGSHPFGAVVVRNGRIVSRGTNSVLPHFDPVAHAEIAAIRTACMALGVLDLPFDLYASCQPCAMCLVVAARAKVATIYFAVDRMTAAKFGFDDILGSADIAKAISQHDSLTAIHRPVDRGTEPFHAWSTSASDLD